MSVQAATLITEVLQRARDQAGSGTSRDTVRTLLDYAQLLVNGAKPGTLTSVNFVIPPSQVLIDTRSFAPGFPGNPRCIWVRRVEHEGRDLVEQSWRSLALANREWLKKLGPRPRVFSRIGRDFIAITPAPIQEQTVTIHYAHQPIPLNSETTPLELADDRLPAVSMLTEALLLVRQQDLENLPMLLQELALVMGQLESAKSAA